MQIEQKILLDSSTCSFLIDYFESDSCIKPGKKSQYNSIGEVGVIQIKDIPKSFVQALKQFNIKEFEFLENVHSPHSLVIHKYSQGDSFPLHRDDNVTNYGSKDLSRALRFKTLVVQLTDEKQYEGGELIVHNTTVNKTQGNIICFNSGMLHEVLPITSGIRYSAALWLLKEDFNLTLNAI